MSQHRNKISQVILTLSDHKDGVFDCTMWDMSDDSVTTAYEVDGITPAIAICQAALMVLRGEGHTLSNE